MRLTWIFLFSMLFVSTTGWTQFHDRTHSHVQWNGLGFLRGTNYLRGAMEHCGVYRTEHDLLNGQLSLAINCKEEDNHKVKRGFVRDQLAVKITRKDEKHSFLKSDIFGYRDCNGNEFHFFEGKTYELVNPGESIRIYRLYEKSGKKRFSKVFFATQDGALQSLTLSNFREEFGDEPIFIEKLNLLAENDFELVKYLHLINRIRDDVRTPVSGQ